MATVTQYGTMCNCFLVEGNGGSVLVDTGAAQMRNNLWEKLRQKDLRLIVLTHWHPDHTANALFLAKLLRVPVAVHAADVEALRGEEKRPMLAETRMGKIIVRMSRKAQLPPEMKKFEPDLLLEDGMTLDKYGVAATVVALPGHTKGSVGVLVEGDGIIVGDALMNVVRPCVAQLYERREKMLQSVGVIRKSGAKRIYVGHGRPFGIEKLLTMKR